MNIDLDGSFKNQNNNVNLNLNIVEEDISIRHNNYYKKRNAGE